MGDYFCLKCKRNHNFRSKIGEAHTRYCFTLPEYLREAIVDVCKKSNRKAPKMIEKYVKEGLIREGLLRENVAG